MAPSPHTVSCSRAPSLLLFYFVQATEALNLIGKEHSPARLEEHFFPLIQRLAGGAWACLVTRPLSKPPIAPIYSNFQLTQAV